MLDKFAANYDSMTDDAARSILKDWMRLEDSTALTLTKKYAKRLREGAVRRRKVLRFVQIENKLDTAVEMEAVRVIPLAKP